MRLCVDEPLKKLFKLSFYRRWILIKYQAGTASQHQGGFVATHGANIKYLLWIDQDFLVIRRQASHKKHTVYPHT